jgi:hypothetical protein
MKRPWLIAFLAMVPASADAQGIPLDEPAWVRSGSGRCCPPPIMPGGAVARSWSCRYTCSPEMSDAYRQALRALAYGDFSECHRLIAYLLQVPWAANATRHACASGHDIARTSAFYGVVAPCWQALDESAAEAETAGQHLKSAKATAGAQHKQESERARDLLRRAAGLQASASTCMKRALPALVKLGDGADHHGTDLYGVQ